MISPTGIWSAEEAIAQNYPHSAKLAAKLCASEIFKMTKFIFDFGCGDAYYIKKLFDCGYHRVVGFDGILKDEPNWMNLLYQLDLSQKFDFQLTAQILCLEVGEHIPVQYEQTFIDNICRHCDSRMVLSWAIEGQGGIGHVNCRNNDYVIDQVQQRGFKLNQLLTDYVREDIEMDVLYFKDTLMVFDKVKL